MNEPTFPYKPGSPAFGRGISELKTMMSLDRNPDLRPKNGETLQQLQGEEAQRIESAVRGN